jgi:hypothetical protein
MLLHCRPRIDNARAFFNVREEFVNVHLHQDEIVMTKTFACIGIMLACGLLAKAQSGTDASAQVRKPLADTSGYLLRVLPSNFYSSNAGFFCKKEWQLQNAIKVPLRLRLRSVGYCDAMEGKNSGHP